LTEFKKNGPPLSPEAAERVANLERMIDEAIDKIYGLSDKEIKLVEKKKVNE
jgi:uncharacterized protein (DUF2384 family)